MRNVKDCFFEPDVAGMVLSTAWVENQYCVHSLTRNLSVKKFDFVLLKEKTQTVESTYLTKLMTSHYYYFFTLEFLLQPKILDMNWIRTEISSASSMTIIHLCNKLQFHWFYINNCDKTHYVPPGQSIAKTFYWRGGGEG